MCFDFVKNLVSGLPQIMYTTLPSSIQLCQIRSFKTIFILLWLSSAACLWLRCTTEVHLVMSGMVALCQWPFVHLGLELTESFGFEGQLWFSNKTPGLSAYMALGQFGASSTCCPKRGYISTTSISPKAWALECYGISIHIKDRICAFCMDFVSTTLIVSFSSFPK